MATLTFQLGVGGPIHLPHPALADLSGDFVDAEAGAWSKGQTMWIIRAARPARTELLPSYGALTTYCSYGFSRHSATDMELRAPPGGMLGCAVCPHHPRTALGVHAKGALRRAGIDVGIEHASGGDCWRHRERPISKCSSTCSGRLERRTTSATTPRWLSSLAPQPPARRVTVQLEGVTDESEGADLARLLDLYFARFPEGRERQSWPGITYLRVTPTWLRYSDFSVDPPEIVEFQARDLT